MNVERRYILMNNKLFENYCINNNKTYLLKEWNFEKNTHVNIDKITIGSDKKVWWKCFRGHQWQSTISNRTRINNTTKGSNCPKCLKSNNTSFPEMIIFYYIKKVFNNAISSYKPDFLNKKELDIYIPNLKLGIEYDGQNFHTEETVECDKEKNKLCFDNGIKLIRVR